MSWEAVISCPRCLCQYAVDSSLDGREGQCGFCRSRFVVGVPRLSHAGEDPIVLYRPLEPQWAYFRDGCASLVKNACLLLAMAGEPVTFAGVANIVNTLPRDVHQLLDEQWQRGYCYMAMKEAYLRPRHPSRESEYREMHEYFTSYIPTRSCHALDMLANATIGVLGGIDWDTVQGIKQPPERKRGPLERWARRRGW